MLARTERVIIVGMGTSLHAAAVGARMFEALARVPAEAENASEFRYRDPVINPATLVISVSQSGETVDTLAAMEEAKSRGAGLIAVTNNEFSQAAVLADATFDIRAGHGDWSCQHKVSNEFHIGPLSGSLLYGTGAGPDIQRTGHPNGG